MEPNNPQSPAALAFEDLGVSRGGVPVLEAVTAHAPLGSCTAIVGPNGAGKTSLLLALLGELPHQGRIRFPASEAAGGGRPRLGYVPQRLDFDRGLPLTVAEFLALGFQRRPLCLGLSRTWRRRAAEALALVGADHLARRRLGALSGGELQRALLALALMQEPELLVLDEPAAGVDFRGELLFCELLDSLRASRGFTQLMVSHDLATVTHHATHVICLNRRVVAEGPPAQALTADNLSRVFGLHMGLVRLRSLPESLSGSGGCAAACCRPPEPPHA